MFRDLRADEIECRVAQAAEKGVSLLLYKDARCDQNILDETVGPMNWQRYHSRENANCIVQIWDSEKAQWIGKEDTGTESNTEKEKGLASDSFKRACFNWGIGRELYTAPFIWIKAEDCKSLKLNERSGKWQCQDSFEVQDIAIENKRIVGLSIKNRKTRNTVFVMGCRPEPEFRKADVMHICEDCGKTITETIGRSGKTWSAEKIVEHSKKTYNGATICPACMEARSKQC